MLKAILITLIALAIAFLNLACSSQQSTSQQPTKSPEPTKSPTSSSDILFVVEKSGYSKQPVKVGKYEVEANQGNILFVTTVKFTEQGVSLPIEKMEELQVSPWSKEMSKALSSLKTGPLFQRGPLVAPGDFQYRLADGTLFPCTFLPLSEKEKEPVMQMKRPDGTAGWLMYVGHIKAVGSVPPGAVPTSLVWGGKYEAPIPAPSR